jgi:DNA (cytosine-5)-methyltransferase 1
MNSPVVYAADLFCGAGGTSTGMLDAAHELGLEVQLVAINHWELAIATHTANHPEVTHLCTGIEDVDPRAVVPGGRLDLLVASPECTFFSTARGGRPINDQGRVSPWLIMDWLEKLDVANVMIENVPDFQDWGPLDANGRPIKRMKGKVFLSYIQAIRALGYHVQYRVLNCADYGDATTRERLFILCRKGHRVRWPEPTHGKPNGPQGELFGQRKPWRAAREIIDWETKGVSIYSRKRPLKPNTMRRIFAGLQKFSGLPFVLGQQSQARPRSVSEPIPTVATAGAISLVQPYLVKFYGSNDAASVDAPLPTITATGQHLGLCEPFIIPYYSERDGQAPRVHSVDEPLPAVTTANRFGLVEPFIVSLEHATKNGAFLVETIHGKDAQRAYSVDEPMRTITSVDAWGLVQPFLVQYNGTAEAQSIEDPLGTVTTRDRFGLAEPILFRGEDGIYMLDILFRMLTPKELARATSLEGYEFVGNREDVVKQIGNAVPRRTAMALCKALLGNKPTRVADTFGRAEA